MSKVEKILLSLSVFLTLLLGIILANVTSIFYRFKRMQVHMEPNEIVKKYCLEMQHSMIFVWIILGTIVVSLVIFSVLVFRKRASN